MIKLYSYLFNIIFYFIESKNEKKKIDLSKNNFCCCILNIQNNTNKIYKKKKYDNIYRTPDIEFKIDDGPIIF